MARQAIQGALEVARDAPDDTGDDMAREARLADHKASLDAREQEISLREEKLEATLRAKDDDLEALVCQRTKDLEDKHGVAMDAIAADSAAQLKKLTDDLAAASAAKTDLDQQVAKLTEELAGKGQGSCDPQGGGAESRDPSE